MILRIARAALNRGYVGIYDFLFALDMTLSRLAGAHRRIRRERKARQDKPKEFVLLEFGEGA